MTTHNPEIYNKLSTTEMMSDETNSKSEHQNATSKLEIKKESDPEPESEVNSDDYVCDDDDDCNYVFDDVDDVYDTYDDMSPTEHSSTEHSSKQQKPKDTIIIMDAQKKIIEMRNRFKTLSFISNDEYCILKHDFTVFCDELAKIEIADSITGMAMKLINIPLIQMNICEIDQQIIEHDDLLLTREANEQIQAAEMWQREINTMGGFNYNQFNYYNNYNNQINQNNHNNHNGFNYNEYQPYGVKRDNSHIS